MSHIDEERDAHEVELEDSDSLFGSPPPSPQIRGRDLSPALALPGQGQSFHSSGATTKQNVGTIALPGSQPVSELAITPLALSLSHNIVVSRPPAPGVQPTPSPSSAAVQQQQQQQQQVLQAYNAAPSTSTAAAAASTSTTTATEASTPRSRTTSTRSGKSTAQSSTSNKPTTKKRRRKPSTDVEEEGSQTSRISFPDPSVPPPAHFLRNQENLLGKAGVVAGVKASHLKHEHGSRHSTLHSYQHQSEYETSSVGENQRGQTPSNPIIINDDDESPSLSRGADWINPAVLETPTNQEIVQVLIGQKDIFPVLQSILKLLSDGVDLPTAPNNAPPQPPPPPRPTGFERRPPGAPTPPPGKKRKLARVPAGAVDWDVPFPFEQGEGPEEYKRNWKKERGRQLIGQLIRLIKGAAKKAAVKRYLEEKEGERERRGRVERGKEREEVARRNVPTGAASSGVENQLEVQAFVPASTMPFDTESWDMDGFSSSGTPFPQSASIDYTSLPTLSIPSFDMDFSTTSSECPTPTAFPTQGQDQALFDTWMTFLQSFPASVSFDAMALNSTATASGFATPTSGDGLSVCSTPAPALDEFDWSGFEGMGMGLGMGTGTGGEGVFDFEVQNQNEGVFNPNSGLDVDSTRGTNMGMDMDMAIMNLGMGAGLGPASTGVVPFLDSNPNGNGMDCINANVDMGLGPTPSGLPNSNGMDVVNANADMDVNMIDPELLAISTPTALNSDNNGDMGMPFDRITSLPTSTVAQAASPVASSTSTTSTSTSYGDSTNTGPATPVTPGWEGDGEIIFGDQMLEGVGMGIEVTRNEKGKGRAVPFELDLGTLDVAEALPAPPSRKERREEIVRRAEEKKKRVKEELARVKMKLWETTIEQAALIQLVRKQ